MDLCESLNKWSRKYDILYKEEGGKKTEKFRMMEMTVC